MDKQYKNNEKTEDFRDEDRTITSFHHLEKSLKPNPEREKEIEEFEKNFDPENPKLEGLS